MWLEQEDEENSSENSEGVLKEGQVGTRPKQASPGGCRYPSDKENKGSPRPPGPPSGLTESSKTARVSVSVLAQVALCGPNSESQGEAQLTSCGS